ncbi:MAG: phosphotransferase family protein [Blastomonas sp.]|jgi:aminoglycoside phosphotransferase (APT) family kinase protein|uniref:phosphotransferase family protein n=1 Tax=unclassified Blastomonas TaxID=2626550 RepID=UPI000829FAC4|nr:phosphotransferase family protein [Blastomonas sp.]MCH2238024.1 phosphotransferase family protein [Blastomonas sp.]OHD02597.1 MAG: aminoglycoside phosphotransferase [Sphingopyxis sp. RIFCSPHIGHO2_01_FULL_65_24]
MIEGINLAALEGWMDAQGVGTGPIAEARLLSGGTQNILMRFRRGDAAYVLRRPPPVPRANSNDTMRREARVLAALDGSAVPHPRLIAACSDEEVLGVAFYLMEPVEGFNPTEGLPELHANDADARHRIGLSMVEAIAALGAIDYRAVGLDGFGKPDNYLERQVGRWRAQLAGYADLPGWPGPGAIPGVDRVASWLDAHRPADCHPGIIHGDFHLANVMVRPDSGNLAAVVDWELSTIGDPLLDLGWLLATWPEDDAPRATDVAITPWEGFASPDELVAHYAETSGRDLSALDWYVVLACFKLGIILEGTHARACAGKAPKDTGDRLHAHTIDLFERALRRIR